MKTSKILEILNSEKTDNHSLILALRDELGDGFTGVLPVIAEKLAGIKENPGKVNEKEILRIIDENKKIDVLALAKEFKCILTDACNGCGCRC